MGVDARRWPLSAYHPNICWCYSYKTCVCKGVAQVFNWAISNQSFQEKLSRDITLFVPLLQITIQYSINRMFVRNSKGTPRVDICPSITRLLTPGMVLAYEEDTNVSLLSDFFTESGGGLRVWHEGAILQGCHCRVCMNCIAVYHVLSRGFRYRTIK